MTTYIISYDLKNASDEDYNKLYEKIKSFEIWAKITESTWALKSEKKAAEIRDELDKITPKGRSLFVIKSGVEAAWKNVICSNEWLKKNL
jgi:hypothetical protein